MPERPVLQRELSALLSAAGGFGASVHICVGSDELACAAGTLSNVDSSPITDKTRFGIACFVRFLISLVALKLAEDGVLDLDASVGSYLPELGCEPKSASILVRHLLAHTGGYRGLDIADGPRWQWPWERCVKSFNDAPQLFSPGTVFNEGHLDHVILGQILRQLTRRSTQELVQQFIFEPLGIESGSLEADDTTSQPRFFGHSYSREKQSFEKITEVSRETDTWAASLSNRTLSATAICKIGRFLMDESKDTGAITKFVRQHVFQPAIVLPKATSAHQNSNWIPSTFSLCCARFPTGFFGYFAAGCGQCCGVVFDPQRKISIGLGLNAQLPLLRTRVLNLIVGHILQHRDPRFDRRKASQPEQREFWDFVSPFKPADLLGRYVGNLNSEVMVTARAGRLRVVLGEQTKAVVGALQRNRLMVEADAAVPVAFLADPGTGKPCIMLGMNVFKKVA
jgi:hypothetical protein